MAGILTALLSGALMSIQGVFNTEVTKQTSTWLAAGWVQISAFAVCLAAWCITGREPHRGSVPRKAVVSAARRGNWRVYHDHGYLEYGRARPGEGGDADRHFPARSGVAD